ncbi:antibiotic biosynthesis monooxygenase [Flavobacteriales bacterium]|jgi:heme-degrading monooxygenase HmoA|nr:antibiotic biosynthesis monooxygenase [Flavobacteriales bacterium]
MITRIVKLDINKGKINDFKSFFEKSKSEIENFKGCKHVELLQDINDSNIFFTYSHWDNEIMLNKYRNSLFFKKVWKTTKLYFSGKPYAWSTKSINNE